MVPQEQRPDTAGEERIHTAEQVMVYPSVSAGYAMGEATTVEAWIQAAWLMIAEGRAYIEDLVGGLEQPHMQQAAKIRWLEQLFDIDQRLAGKVAVDDAHCLALALEYGTRETVSASGPQLADIFGLDEEFGGETCHTKAVLVLWERLLREFPGELPDRLVADGQRDLLRTLRRWAPLARSVGLDIGFLAPLMKAA